jgi:transcriptional regulator with XRE-family HTH domain
LNNNLKKIREDRDLTQKQVSMILGIEQTNYSKYELGKNMMGIDKYITLAKFYDVSIDYLCGLTDEPRTINGGQTLTYKKAKK